METQTQRQNLLRQVPAETITRPPGFYKSIGFDVAVVLSAILFSFTYRGFLDDRLNIWFVVAALGIFSTLSLLGTFLTRHFGRRAFVIFLESAGLIAFFYGEPANVLVAVFCIVLFFLFWGDIIGRSDLANALTIRFMRTSKFILSKMMTGLVLVLIVLYFPKLDVNKAFLPQPVFEGFFTWASGVVNSFYSEINFSDTFETFVESIVLVRSQDDPAFRGLAPAEQARYLKKVTGDTIIAFGESAGVVLEAEKSVSSVAYDFFTQLLANWKKKFGSIFFVIWVAAIFLIVRSIAVIFYWGIGFLGFILYQVLLSMGFVRILGESRTREVLDYA